MPFGLLAVRYLNKLEQGDPAVVAFHQRWKKWFKRWFRGKR